MKQAIDTLIHFKDYKNSTVAENYEKILVVDKAPVGRTVTLRDDFESSAIDGLFYLGRGTQRSFTSRFIRGIREDALVLAQVILGKAASKNKSQ